MPISGCYAEYVCLPASKLIRVPPGLDPAEAVSCAELHHGLPDASPYCPRQSGAARAGARRGGCGRQRAAAAAAWEAGGAGTVRHLRRFLGPVQCRSLEPCRLTISSRICAGDPAPARRRRGQRVRRDRRPATSGSRARYCALAAASWLWRDHDVARRPAGLGQFGEAPAWARGCRCSGCTSWAAGCCRDANGCCPTAFRR